MVVQVEWDNEEKTILRYRFIDHWTWVEYLEQLEAGRDMMASVTHNVCILNDLQASKSVPPNFVTTARTVISSRPDNTGIAIFVTASKFFKVLHHILSQLIPDVPTEYILVTSEQEAYTRINQWLEEHATKNSGE